MRGDSGASVPPAAAPAYDRGMAGTARTLARIALGGFLTFAGVSHLTVARREFRAQVPDWVPVDPDTTVVASGVVEVGLGTALLFAWRQRRLVGVLTALFFIAIFPGNVSQWTHHRDGFGLDTDMKRFARLFFQPVLVWLALWSTRRG